MGKFIGLDVAKDNIYPYIGASIDQYPKRWKVTDPRTYISDKLPPIMIIHGAKDSLVPIEGSKEYVALANKMGARVELVSVPFSNHTSDFISANSLIKQTELGLILNYLQNLDNYFEK